MLRLKVGAVCLITRNLSSVDHLVNGTKVVVEAITPRLVTVKVVTTQKQVRIPRISFNFKVTHTRYDC